MKLIFSYWSCAALVAASLVAIAPTAATAQSAEYQADYQWVDGATGKFKCGNGTIGQAAECTGDTNTDACKKAILRTCGS